MLGHLVSTGHAASPDPEARIAPARSLPQPGQGRHPGWFSRLFAQIFHRR